MAVRQYIGARYVPRFLGTYDPTTIYEALDVVDNGSGSSYIARKTVPAGTSLTDPEYWFLYGASSGAILNLQSRMSAAESNIVDITSRLDRRFIFIGDSYGTGEGPDNNYTGWIDRVISGMGLTLNDNAFKNAYGGTSWKGLNGRKSYKMLLEEIENSVSDKDTITDIVVCGGVNDAVGTVSDGLTGRQEFYNYAHALYPNATIRMGLIGWSSSRSDRQNILSVSLPIYTLGGFYGMAPLDFKGPVLHDYVSDFQSDGIHPTDSAQSKLAWAIISCLNGGYGAYINPEVINDSLATTWFNDAQSVNIIINPDKILLRMSAGRRLLSNAATFAWRTTIDFGTFTHAQHYIDHIYKGEMNIPCVLQWSDGTTRYTPVNLSCEIQDGHLYGLFTGDESLDPGSNTLQMLTIPNIVIPFDPYIA